MIKPRLYIPYRYKGRGFSTRCHPVFRLAACGKSLSALNAGRTKTVHPVSARQVSSQAPFPGPLSACGESSLKRTVLPLLLLCQTLFYHHSFKNSSWNTLTIPHRRGKVKTKMCFASSFREVFLIFLPCKALCQTQRTKKECQFPLPSGILPQF